MCSLESSFQFLPERSFAFTTGLFGTRGVASGPSHFQHAFLAELHYFQLLIYISRCVTLTLAHLEATVALGAVLASALLCLRDEGGPRRGRETGAPVDGSVTTHATCTEKLTSVGPGAPIIVVTSKI